MPCEGLQSGLSGIEPWEDSTRHCAHSFQLCKLCYANNRGQIKDHANKNSSGQSTSQGAEVGVLQHPLLESHRLAVYNSWTVPVKSQWSDLMEVNNKCQRMPILSN